MLVRSIIIVSKGLVVLLDHTIYVYGVAAIMYLREWACDDSIGDSIDDEEYLGEAILEYHLYVEKGLELSMGLSYRELSPCVSILARGSNKN
jgi:hypothetical protein